MTNSLCGGDLLTRVPLTFVVLFEKRSSEYLQNQYNSKSLAQNK